MEGTGVVHHGRTLAFCDHPQFLNFFPSCQAAAQSVIIKGLQLKHAARTVGQRGRLVLMSDINGRTLNLLLAGRYARKPNTYYDDWYIDDATLSFLLVFISAFVFKHIHTRLANLGRQRYYCATNLPSMFLKRQIEERWVLPPCG